MRERDANKRNIPIIAKVRSKRKSPERGVETGLRHLQMPREKRQQRNNLSHPEQIVEHAAGGGSFKSGDGKQEAASTKP